MCSSDLFPSHDTWTGISGLSSQQQALDNESNNIANVNTIGFKASRISFADQMYQDRIGKGSKILDAEKLYTQGGLKLTGVNYDMALSGDGWRLRKNFDIQDGSQYGNKWAILNEHGSIVIAGKTLDRMREKLEGVKDDVYQY